MISTHSGLDVVPFVDGGTWPWSPCLLVEDDDLDKPDKNGLNQGEDSAGFVFSGNEGTLLVPPKPYEDESLAKEDSQSFTGAVEGFDEDRLTVKVLVLLDSEVIPLSFRGSMSA